MKGTFMIPLINEPYMVYDKRNQNEVILPMKDDERMLSVLEEFRVQNKNTRDSLSDGKGLEPK
jgi:hypothetical protein